MHRHLFLLALVAGCDTAVDATAADQAPPVAGQPAFVVGMMVAGFPSKVTFEDPDLAVGSRARLFLSPNGAGAGPCPPALGGLCTGLLMPIRQIATANVSPPTVLVGGMSGTTYTSDPWVSFDVTPPASLPTGITFGMQAAGQDGSGGVVLSPGVNKTSEFAFCPLYFAPTCGVTGAFYGNYCEVAAAGDVALTAEGEGC